MSASSGAPPKKRAALGLQIKLPCPTRTAVVERYGQELGLGLLFVRTPRPRAVDTVVRLELLFSNGAPLLRAAAIVARAVEPGVPGSATELVEPGMELRFVAADESGRQLIAELGGPKLLPLKNDAFLAANKSEPPRTGPAARVSAPPPMQPIKTPAPPVRGDIVAVPTNVPAPRPSETAAPAVASPRQTGPIIGIDLGTSNSCAAVVREGKPRIIASREGHNTVPSVVALSESGKLLVGHPAKSQLLINPETTVYGAKRLLGRSFDSPVVREVAARVPYAIVKGPRGEAAVQLGERVFSLQEISAMVLREVKAQAERDYGLPVTRAVITVPANYSDKQRQAVREAGALAGLTVERILSEPTAAALAFAHGRALEKRVLVYDLGGGTFDVSLLELRGNIYEVVSTGGDTFLGGVDFDRVLVESLLGSFQEQHNNPFPDDRAALQRVTDAAERAKIALSEQLEVQVHEPQIVELGERRVDLEAIVSRSELVMLTGHLVDQTLSICREVLGARGLSPKDVQEVLLVGGQSRMPLVRERIRNFFGREPSKAVHPDEAVALGAALLAHELESGAIDGVVLIDVLPMGIGVGVPGARFEEVIERNTPVPHKQLVRPLIAREGQTSLELAVFQGDPARLDDPSQSIEPGDRRAEIQLEEAEYLGTLLLRDLPPMARGSSPVEVEIVLDEECLLSASARDVATGNKLAAAFGMSETGESARRRLQGEEPFAGKALIAAPSTRTPLSARPFVPSALDANGSEEFNPLLDSGESEAVASAAARALAETAEMVPLSTDPARAPAANPASKNPASPAPAPARRGWLRGIFGKRR